MAVLSVHTDYLGSMSCLWGGKRIPCKLCKDDSHRVCGIAGALPEERQGSTAAHVAVINLNAMKASCKVSTPAVHRHLAMVAYNTPYKV